MLTHLAHTNLFTSDEVTSILKYMGQTSDTTYPVYIDGNYNDVGCKMQSYELEWNKNTNWIFLKLQNWIDTLNLGIKLIHPPHAVFRKYEVGDFFIKHTDQPPNPTPKRYLSVGIQLSNESEYEGGNIYIYKNSDVEIMPKSIGYTYLFGIKVPHEVTRITKGTRKSLTIFISENHIKKLNLI